jgi:hypothetical protein
MVRKDAGLLLMTWKEELHWMLLTGPMLSHTQVEKLVPRIRLRKVTCKMPHGFTKVPEKVVMKFSQIDSLMLHLGLQLSLV